MYTYVCIIPAFYACMYIPHSYMYIFTHQHIYQVTTEYTALRALHSKKKPALSIKLHIIYIYIYIYVYIYTHTRTHTRAAHIHAHIHWKLYKHTQVYQVTTEYTALRELHRQKSPALRIQTPLAYGCHNDQAYVLVTDLLGDNVQALVPRSGFVSPKTVLLLAHQVKFDAFMMYMCGCVRRYNLLAVVPDYCLASCKLCCC